MYVLYKRDLTCFYLNDNLKLEKKDKLIKKKYRIITEVVFANFFYNFLQIREEIKLTSLTY